VAPQGGGTGHLKEEVAAKTIRPRSKDRQYREMSGFFAFSGFLSAMMVLAD